MTRDELLKSGHRNTGSEAEEGVLAVGVEPKLGIGQQVEPGGEWPSGLAASAAPAAAAAAAARVDVALP